MAGHDTFKGWGVPKTGHDSFEGWGVPETDYDSLEGAGVPKTGYDSFEGWGVPEEINKNIQWVNNRWECEPFIVELIKVINDERIPVNIDPKTVEISDTRDWLEKDGEPVRGIDKKWQVPVRIKEDKLKELVPEGYNEIHWKSPVFSIGELPEDQTAPPQKKLTTRLTVTVEIVSAAESAIGAATGAALGSAGIAPIAGSSVSKLSQPDREVISSPVNYIVIPPKPRWVPEQKKPLLLSGKGLEETVTLTLDKLPEGWDTGLTVTCALPDTASKNMGFEIVSITSTRTGTGISTGTQMGTGTGIPTGTQMGTGTGTSTGSMASITPGGAMKPDEISAEIKIKNSLLCMKTNTEVLEDPETSLFPIAVSTKSAFLGSSCQWAPTVVQPVEISIYFEKEPAFNYFKLDEKRYVRVIRKGTEQDKIPRRSKLAVSLESTKDADISPRIQWDRDDTSMNDDFLSKSEPKTTYKAPTQDMWEHQNEPPTIIVRCMVGPDEEVKIIENAPGEMYSTALIESYIVLKKPLGYAKIKCNVSPSELPKADQMDLINKDVLENFHREFSILVDLQKIADEAGGD